jgi:hypothetical protein
VKSIPTAGGVSNFVNVKSATCSQREGETITIVYLLGGVEKMKDILIKKVNLDGSVDIELPAVNATITSIICWDRETLAFNERLNRWTSFYSYQPEMMVGSNLDIISFKEGVLWKHNSNKTRNNFYGTSYNSELTLVSNISPMAIKVYDAIEIESTAGWSMEFVNAFGQKTSLETTDFENIEGVFWASFLKDENTPNVNFPIFEGDDMRCHSGTIKLINKDTTDVKLFSASVRIATSELTNK